ncbi:hypothetical protein [Komagataeibacter xylinus]|uniref:hypothetical protein n=1 Tax=Komagataeibacter xylinus TaxID=28448 RepID=UPI0038D22A16
MLISRPGSGKTLMATVLVIKATMHHRKKASFWSMLLNRKKPPAGPDRLSTGCSVRISSSAMSPVILPSAHQCHHHNQSELQ